MKFWLVTYDIVDDKRRLKVANLLEDYGKRVQYSVFEVWLPYAELETFKAKLQNLIESKSDSVRLYELCGTCQQKVVVLGQGMIPSKPSTIII